jgi:hypothetical protein
VEKKSTSPSGARNKSLRDLGLIASKA